jgi:tRNA(fMet)-specific endonuclease VapC
MSGNDVALDTSAAVKLLNDIDLAKRFLSGIGRAFLPTVAVGELLFGALNSAQSRTNLPRYQQFIDNCQVLPVSKGTAEIYARTRLQLKTQGFPIPDSDIWIAANALERSLPIVTTDRHFSYVPGLVLFPLDPSA